MLIATIGIGAMIIAMVVRWLMRKYFVEWIGPIVLLIEQLAGDEMQPSDRDTDNGVGRGQADAEEWCYGERARIGH